MYLKNKKEEETRKRNILMKDEEEEEYTIKNMKNKKMMGLKEK